MVRIIKLGVFWGAIVKLCLIYFLFFFFISLWKNTYCFCRIKHHLAPLAIAANVTQSTHCRLDEVLLIFGTLVMEYCKLTDPDDIPVRDALMSSIERQWEKSDQDVFVACIILNPFIKVSVGAYV